MKYWWLTKYKKFKIIQIGNLTYDVNNFLVMPKNYEKQYEKIKNLEVKDLEEEDLLIILYKIVNTKNIKDNKLRLVIEKLLTYQDNSFPKSDYSLEEILEEIKNLSENPPLKEKLDNNNISICYNCLNIFYVDKIKNVNKSKLCLCPYCHSTKLYFDNDYIPMNYAFIKFASIYYKTSKLGSTFQSLKKILKREVKLTVGKKESDSILFNKIFNKDKIKPIDEKVITYNLENELLKKENELLHKTSIYIPNLKVKNKTELLLIIITCLMEVLTNSVYLREVKLIFKNEETKKQFDKMLKTIISFY